MKNQVSILFLSMLLILSGCGVGEEISTLNKATDTSKLKDVSFTIGSAPNSKFVPFYLTLEKGFYEEEGLNVDINGVAGSTIVVKLIASGSSDFGLASGNTILTGKTKGMPLKVVAVYWQKSPSAVIFSKDSGIKNPKDLEGKKIASNPQSTIRQEFVAFAKKNNIDLDKITFLSVGSASAESQTFLNGQADAFVGYYDRAAVILEDNEINNFDKMMFDEYGIEIYSQAVVVNEYLIEEDPELIRSFLRATIKGIEYSLDHPSEAVESLIHHNPEMEFDSELKKFLRMKELIENEVADEYGIGHQDTAKWDSTQEILYELGLIEEKIDVNNLYTNEFLSKVFIVN